MNKSECLTMIDGCDRTLKSLSGLWTAERDEGKREKLMEAINNGLDERIKLMKIRTQ